MKILHEGVKTKSNLRKLASMQKQTAAIIITNEALNINEKKNNLSLNVKKLNIYQLLIFSFRIDQGTIPIIFRRGFKKATHTYSTRFRESNFCEKSFKLTH